MAIFPKLFPSSVSPAAPALPSGPETVPVQMNLEERMAFRRELLFECLSSGLSALSIAPEVYRMKVMRTDKRGHCFMVMFDVSPRFLASERGSHEQLSAIATALTQTALSRHSLTLTGVYWRLDDTVDTPVAPWARPSDLGKLPGVAAQPRFRNSGGGALEDAQDMLGARSYATDMTQLEDSKPGQSDPSSR
jgi:hypothetical protein